MDVPLPTMMVCFRKLAQPRAEFLLPSLNRATARWGIASPIRLAHFFAQLSIESGDLRYWKELGDGMRYDISVNPHLAEALGNTESGDGPRYIGRGPLQITGRSNYRDIGKLIGYPLEEQPELLEQPDPGFQAAGGYWESRGLSQLADQDDSETITRRINGSLTAYPQRLGALIRCKLALGVGGSSNT